MCFPFYIVFTPFSVLNCEVSCPENVCFVGCDPAAEHRVLLRLFVVSLCFCSGRELEI